MVFTFFEKVKTTYSELKFDTKKTGIHCTNWMWSQLAIDAMLAEIPGISDPSKPRVIPDIQFRLGRHELWHTVDKMSHIPDNAVSTYDLDKHIHVLKVLKENGINAPGTTTMPVHLICTVTSGPAGITAIKRLIEQRCDINELDELECSPADILLACSRPGSSVVLEWLISQGCMPNQAAKYITDSMNAHKVVSPNEVDNSMINVLISNGFYKEEQLKPFNNRVKNVLAARNNCRKAIVIMIGLRKKKKATTRSLLNLAVWDKFLVRHMCFEIWATRRDLNWVV